MRPNALPILVLLAVAVLNFAANIPKILDFNQFAFGDPGWALTVDAMLDAGLVPTRDFTYFYGLLTLLVDRAWFAVAGRTPEAVVGLYAVANLASTVGVIRVLRAAEVGRWGWLLGAAAIPLLVVPGLIPSPAHALEPALLVNALAFQIRGRLGWALALATVAVFVKPSLGYVYGLLLVVHVVTGWPHRWPNRLTQFIPPIVAAAVLAGVLSAYFGWDAVVRTQLPLGAGKAYEEGNFGFFSGIGRKFWQPEAPSPAYYLRTPAGVWVLASLVLLFGTVRAVGRLREPGCQLIVTCAVLHVVFVCVFFGNQWSWIYYPFFPFLGAAVVVDRLGGKAGEASDGAWVWRALGRVMFGLFLLVDVTWVGFGCANLWQNHQRSSVTAGLYATGQYELVWAQVRRAAEKDRVFVLTRMGCAPLLTPGVEGPRSWCLIRAIAVPAEMDYVREELRTSDWVLVPNWHDNDLVGWPEFAPLMRSFRPALRTSWFTLYRRLHGAPAADTTAPPSGQ